MPQKERGRITLFGYARWRPKLRVYSAGMRGSAGEPVELNLKNLSGRFGRLRVVPPHPALSLREREQPCCVFPKTDVAPTGTVRSAIQGRDTRTTQRVRFATKRREILPQGRGRGEGEASGRIYVFEQGVIVGEQQCLQPFY